VLTAVIVAFIVEPAKGHIGNPYGWLGAIGGLSYLGRSPSSGSAAESERLAITLGERLTCSL